MKGDGDVLNTTDDELSQQFRLLSIHSPSSPSYNQCDYSGAQISSQQNKTTSSQFGQSSPLTSPSNRCLSPRRSYLECVVPAIAPFIDRIRTFWPFGKGESLHGSISGVAIL